ATSPAYTTAALRPAAVSASVSTWWLTARAIRIAAAGVLPARSAPGTGSAGSLEYPGRHGRAAEATAPEGIQPERRITRGVVVLGRMGGRRKRAAIVAVLVSRSVARAVPEVAMATPAAAAGTATRHPAARAIRSSRRSHF